MKTIPGNATVEYGIPTPAQRCRADKNMKPQKWVDNNATKNTTKAGQKKLSVTWFSPTDTIQNHLHYLSMK